MELSQPPLIRIYQSCEVLMSIKRKLFQSLNIDSLPSSPYNEQKRTISSRVYLYIKKISKQMKNQLSELSSGPDKQSHMEIVNKVITNLKNHNEFLSQEQKLIMQANKIIEQWHLVEDPLVYYEQNQRTELRKSLSSKLSEINTFSVACRQTKKPLYVRKLQRELKDNLCIIAETQRKYNVNQYSLASNIRKKIIKLLLKLLESASTKEKTSYVEVQKNLLLSRYIDVFHGKERKASHRDLLNYRQDVLKTIKNIELYFQDEMICFQALLSYMNNMESTIKNFQKQVLNAEDSITDVILDISPDINHIVNFEDTLEIINNTKGFFFSQAEWSEFTSKIPKIRIYLQEAMNLLSQYSKKTIKREDLNRNQAVAQFIEDKKFLELISTKEEAFEFSIFESLSLFFEKLYKNRNSLNLKYIERDEVKKFKFEKALTNIFENYFKEIQTKDKSSDGKSSNYQSYKLSLNQQNQVKKIEEFIESLHVFDEQINWKDSYQCSLGPRLLIHGKMKILPEGIVYFSNFNKRNYFFGKTRIFIPKEDVFEINKQSALMIFPDVIEVITKKKGVYFHALGKRQKIVEELNLQYFPEVNQSDQLIDQIRFNEFKGNIEIAESRIKPYTQNLQYFIGQGDFPNINLRSYFHKYESEEEFQYQGKTYPSFKYYSIEIAEGTNIQGAKFTPGIPYYMQVFNKMSSEVKDDIQETQRFFTFKKEVPMIPFVSKGGHGICQEKTIYRWGGPKILVVDLYTTLSGFSLTEGMLVRARQVFQEKKNCVHYTFSGEVTFQTTSALNNMLRAPALSNLKGFMLNLFQVIKKIEKTRKVKRVGSKKMIPEDDDSQYEERIQQLQLQNVKLRKMLYRAGFLAIVIYLVTIFFMIFY